MLVGVSQVVLHRVKKALLRQPVQFCDCCPNIGHLWCSKRKAFGERPFALHRQQAGNQLIFSGGQGQNYCNLLHTTKYVFGISHCPVAVSSCLVVGVIVGISNLKKAKCRRCYPGKVMRTPIHVSSFILVLI